MAGSSGSGTEGCGWNNRCDATWKQGPCCQTHLVVGVREMAAEVAAAAGKAAKENSSGAHRGQKRAVAAAGVLPCGAGVRADPGAGEKEGRWKGAMVTRSRRTGRQDGAG